jgi:hypothetical protein
MKQIKEECQAFIPDFGIDKSHLVDFVGLLPVPTCSIRREILENSRPVRPVEIEEHPAQRIG